MIDGHPVCVGNAAAKATVGAATFFVVTALAGGGVGGATSASGSVREYGPRLSRNEPNARPNRGESEARARGIADSVRITTRLQKLGYRVTFRATRDDKNCADYSDGEVQIFLREHPCRSMYRETIGLQDKKGEIVFGMAMIEMDDHQAARDLQKLLDQADRGKIIQLSPDSGKYHLFRFANSFANTVVRDTTVVVCDVQIVSGTPGPFVLNYLFNNI